jgi:predicted DNA-binding transcriptional regulator AlpA
MSGLVGIKAICRYTGMSESTVMNWITLRDFPAVKVGGIWMSDGDEIDDWRKGIIRRRHENHPAQEARRAKR